MTNISFVQVYQHRLFIWQHSVAFIRVVVHCYFIHKIAIGMFLSFSWLRSVPIWNPALMSTVVSTLDCCAGSMSSIFTWGYLVFIQLHPLIRQWQNSKQYFCLEKYFQCCHFELALNCRSCIPVRESKHCTPQMYAKRLQFSP